MNSNILANCIIKIKEPKSCSDKELSDFYDKVKKGGKVMSQGLSNRIRNCELLAFCYYDKSLIAISSIKRPSPNYVAEIIKKTEIKRTIEDLTFEIGYSFTEADFRKNGISKELKSKLLKEMNYRKGIIFSTTAITSSQNFLEDNGFKKIGKSYDGDNDKGISYYERK